VAAPTITSVVPALGLSLGETFVTINGTGFNDDVSGGTIRVLFGTVEALEYGAVDSTKVIALTPGGEVGDVDVTVVNVPASGPDEPTTLSDGFEYRRPAIETKRDHSEDEAIVAVTRTLVKELRRTVLANTHHDMHPEYVDDVSALVPEEKQEEVPSLEVRGPSIQEDRFYAVNGRYSVRTSAAPGGTHDTFNQPVTLRLEYQYVGVARSTGEISNLFAAVTGFFNRTPFLSVPVDGLDPANGTIEFELSPVWEQRAEFRSRATRAATYQFEGSFVVRGVHVVGDDKVSEGKDVSEVVVETETLP